MAEGWEKVIVAGSWIWTGAGTGVEVGSEEEADEAAESKEGASKAAEGK